ncbi:hypothetical protein FACS1894166_13400 [Bacilli bacterium]|nr:hypothetical protein FACS1894166_13400 [Bacilli bacterium]
MEIQNPHIIITPVQCFTFVERGYYSDGMTSEKANKRKGYLQNAIHTLIVPKETLPFYQSY